MKITFGGKEVTLIGTELKVGDSLPEFNLTATDLSTFSSRDMKLPAIVLTFPSVDTSVCSLELLTFNDRLEGLNYNVYGISCDLPFTLDRWIKTNAGDYITMLSDYKHHDFGEASGTLINEFRILARAAFVFDKDGICQYTEYLAEVGTEPNYDRIMEEAKKYF
ncbi:thiol peroxidase [Proteiniclasticum sp. QWL-01]|uniref:thiol peroxidase n=1 Tax=Proteiniclasticum sp. QWL-01 TaxID=3036945 RepID=UPI00220758F6|nr:thiol peroxidase [Proteiniclasticum sp. QWL-01]UUM12547.1 thiol peroxidase [Clostridiaceae bacterium HFYG-1003]WFF74103.1 thiol peroxidase [Proteiniclasticum sp. QWL-01]